MSVHILTGRGTLITGGGFITSACGASVGEFTSDKSKATCRDCIAASGPQPIKPVAGPELDALVAEKVMGIVIVHREWPCGLDPGCGCPVAAIDKDKPCPWHTELRAIYNTSGCVDGVLDPVPHYSTDIAAAWEVVEQARLQITPCGSLWFAAIIPRECENYEDQRLRKNGKGANTQICTDEWLDGVCAATAPLAICLAALKAVGVDCISDA